MKFGFYGISFFMILITQCYPVRLAFMVTLSVLRLSNNFPWHLVIRGAGSSLVMHLAAPPMLGIRGV